MEFYKAEEVLPEQGIRVIGYEYSAPNKYEYLIGDIYYGQKGCSFDEAAKKGFWDFGKVCWRYSHDESEVTKHKVTHWTNFPETPFEKPSVWI